MTREVFFFVSAGPLLCENVKRDGANIRGDVINGAWRMRHNLGEGVTYAYDGKTLVNKTRERIVRTVVIPEDKHEHYNVLIQWASEQGK